MSWTRAATEAPQTSRQEDVARETQEAQSEPERSPRHWKRPKTEVEEPAEEGEEVL